MGEKTEEATPKKLADARKKGQVAKSQDVPSAATFLASFIVVMAMGDGLSKEMGANIINSFSAITRADRQYIAGWLIIDGLRRVLVMSLPICATSAVVGLAANFLMVGPLFTFEVLKPDFKKMDPIQGIKNKFNVKTLFEVGKSLLKISLAAFLIYKVIEKNVAAVISSAAIPYLDAVTIYATFLKEVIKKVGALFFVIAVIDFIFQKRQFANSMKMEKHEIKQEYKNSEGDPQIKGKRKEIAREIAMGEGGAPARNVKKAKAVVTNPTHLAIAIDYAPEKGIIAPFIVAMGRGYHASIIVQEAKKWDVPIVQNISLAHILFQKGSMYDFIPEETYHAIAEILRWVASLQKEGKNPLL